MSEKNPDIAFDGNSEAFDFACTELDCAIDAGKAIAAVVVDAREHYGADTSVKQQPDGTQLAAIRVASEDGGFVTLAHSASAEGPDLEVGDLVAWYVGKYFDEMAASAPDPRGGWLGVIVATLEPHYRRGAWAGRDRFV